MSHKPIEELLDSSTLAALRAAGTATCELLDPDSVDQRPKALIPARTLPAIQVTEFKNLLLDPASWFFARKRCLPKPAALFRLAGEEGSLRVSISIPCHGWIVIGPRGRWGSFFDPVQDQVRALLKETFAEFASSSPRSLWKAGAIAKLQAARQDATRAKET